MAWISKSSSRSWRCALHLAESHIRPDILIGISRGMWRLWTGWCKERRNGFRNYCLVHPHLQSVANTILRLITLALCTQWLCVCFLSHDREGHWVCDWWRRLTGMEDTRKVYRILTHLHIRAFHNILCKFLQTCQGSSPPDIKIPYNLLHILSNMYGSHSCWSHVSVLQYSYCMPFESSLSLYQCTLLPFVW